MSKLFNTREIARLSKIAYGPLNRAMSYDRMDKLNQEDANLVISIIEEEIKRMKAQISSL